MMYTVELHGSVFAVCGFTSELQLHCVASQAYTILFAKYCDVSKCMQAIVHNALRIFPPGIYLMSTTRDVCAQTFLFLIFHSFFCMCWGTEANLSFGLNPST